MTVRFEALAELRLERREPALHRGVVVAVALSGHAAGDTARLQRSSVVFAGVRAALVGMVEKAGVGCAPLQCHIECTQREMSIVHGRQRQPTTKREKRSRMTARYSLPPLVTSSVVSPTHR